MTSPSKRGIGSRAAMPGEGSAADFITELCTGAEGKRLMYRVPIGK